MSRHTDPHSLTGPVIMDWHDRIALDPAILVGKPCIKGTRISVEFVVDLLSQGWTTQKILEQYGHLSHEDLLACLTYAGDVLKSEFVLPPEP